MKRKGFTLIELLAVIIILGILMLIAIPSVTNYINNSRKSTYVTTINELLKGTINKINSGELNLFDTDTTYYVPCTCIKLENGEAKSPYGKFDPAYVVVTYDGSEYHYYFTGKDVQNMGVPVLTSSDVLSKENIVANVSSIDTTVGIEGTSNVYVFSDECNGEGEIGPASTTVSGESQSNMTEFKGICKKATTLHTSTCQIRCNNERCGCGEKIGFDNTITYGTIPNGTPKAGDAYDCDVNNDGIFDEETERFYYVSNYYDLNTNTFDKTKSVLIYYSNINDQTTYAYASLESAQEVGVYTSSGGCNWHGPLTAYQYLPSLSEWSNPKIIAPGTRSFKDEKGAGSTMNGYYIIKPLTYIEKASRLLTTQEIEKGCSNITNIANFTIGELDGCNYLLENIGGYEKESGAAGYWLETPQSNSNYSAFRVRGIERTAYPFPTTESEYYGVRPVITVKTSDIEK